MALEVSKIRHTPQPHYIPGYTGFVPDIQFRCGDTYGNATHKILVDPSVNLGKSVLSNSHHKRTQSCFFHEDPKKESNMEKDSRPHTAGKVLDQPSYCCRGKPCECLQQQHNKQSQDGVKDGKNMSYIPCPYVENELKIPLHPEECQRKQVEDNSDVHQSPFLELKLNIRPEVVYRVQPKQTCTSAGKTQKTGSTPFCATGPEASHAKREEGSAHISRCSGENKELKHHESKQKLNCEQRPKSLTHNDKNKNSDVCPNCDAWKMSKCAEHMRQVTERCKNLVKQNEKEQKEENVRKEWQERTKKANKPPPGQLFDKQLGRLRRESVTNVKRGPQSFFHNEQFETQHRGAPLGTARLYYE